MIDIANEDIMTFSQAAEWLPRRRKGRKVAASTLWRWASVGIAGIRLEVIFVGASRCTSKAALQRFFEKISEARSGGSTTDSTQPAGRTRTVAQRRKDNEQSRNTLVDMINHPPKRGKAGAGSKA
jgi:Protein of unknown function (DUF1580)